jgi:antitoxin component YwqK of YwqJK toxin-antitoxin module
MRRLPFHPEDGIGPKCIVLTPEMAKYNSRGKLLSESYYRGNRQHGLYTSYYPNGKIKEQGE